MLLVLLPLLAVGQIKNKVATNVNIPILEVIESDALQFKIHVLTRAKGQNLNELKANFEKELVSGKTNIVIKKNRAVFKEFLANVKNMSEIGTTFFDTNGAGLGVYTFNKLNTIMFGGIISNYELNTLRLDAAARANRVAREVLLPNLTEFKTLLGVSEVSYFSLSAGYIARDFGEDEDSVVYKDGETLTIIISKSVLKKYINAEITDEDVFKLASFYSSTKSTTGLRKVTIK